MKPISSQTISALVCTMRATLKGMAGKRKSPSTYCRPMIRPNRICATNSAMAAMKYGFATAWDLYCIVISWSLAGQPWMLGGHLAVLIWLT